MNEAGCLCNGLLLLLLPPPPLNHAPALVLWFEASDTSRAAARTSYLVRAANCLLGWLAGWRVSFGSPAQLVLPGEAAAVALFTQGVAAAAAAPAEE